MIRIFDLSPTNGTLATASQFWSALIPVRGARSVTLAFQSSAGSAGTPTVNARLGDEARNDASSADRMQEGGTGQYTSSAMSLATPAANLWFYQVFQPILGRVFGHAYMRFRIPTTTANVTGVTLRAIVDYEPGQGPDDDPSAVRAGTAILTPSN